MGQAKADAYQVGVSALGIDSYTMLQAIQTIADGSVRVVSDVAVNGSGGGAGLLDGLMATFLRNETSKNGDKAGKFPVLNEQKLEPAVVEPLVKLPVAKANYVKSPKSPESPNHSPIAKCEAVADIDEFFGESPSQDI